MFTSPELWKAEDWMAETTQQPRKQQAAPAFQFYPRDWLASMRTTLLTLEEEGAYIRLLCFCWRDESIPSDVATLRRLVGKGVKKSTIETVRAMFVPHPTDASRLVHDKLARVRADAAEFHAGRSAAGKKGAAARWHSDGKPDGSANGKDDGKAIANECPASASASASATPPSKPPAGWLAGLDGRAADVAIELKSHGVSEAKALSIAVNVGVHWAQVAEVWTTIERDATVKNKPAVLISRIESEQFGGLNHEIIAKRYGHRASFDGSPLTGRFNPTGVEVEGGKIIPTPTLMGALAHLRRVS